MDELLFNLLAGYVSYKQESGFYLEFNGEICLDTLRLWVHSCISRGNSNRRLMSPSTCYFVLKSAN